MKMEACGGRVEDLLSSCPAYKEEEEEENPNARQQKLLWDMAQVGSCSSGNNFMFVTMPDVLLLSQPGPISKKTMDCKCVWY